MRLLHFLVPDRALRIGESHDPDDGRATSADQHRMLDDVARLAGSGTISGERITAALMAVGPIRGSYGDYRGFRCHHMAPYPGCRGGCARS